MMTDSFGDVTKAIADLRRRAQELDARARTEYFVAEYMRPEDVMLRLVTEDDDPEKILETLDSIKELSRPPSAGGSFDGKPPYAVLLWVVVSVKRNNRTAKNQVLFSSYRRYANETEARSYVPKQNDSSAYIRNVSTKKTFRVLMK
jgi:hypothetical protein